MPKISIAETTVMILAAGRGKRMGELTEQRPKPLLQVHGQCLIEYHLYALAKQGFQNVVINTAYLGEQIPTALGNGERYGLHIQYSHEQALGLETAGGIVNALPLLGDRPFIVINSDVWCDYDFSKLQLEASYLAHLVLANNPEHNPKGDFVLNKGSVKPKDNEQQTALTFSGIGIYHPDLFKKLTPGFRPLREPLLDAMHKGKVSGEHHKGEWRDIGTPERLNELEEILRHKKAQS